MRVNMPVTGVEKVLQDSDVIVSRTDTKGLITYINKTFCDISGFTEEELLGAPHNLVRHPDMPPAAFEDLWNTLKAGKSWKGLVKNRCKNGDHYWIEANANPIYENGRIVGYMSLRTKPAREAVEFCENLYRKRARRQRPRLDREGRPGAAYRHRWLYQPRAQAECVDAHDLAGGRVVGAVHDDWPVSGYLA